MSEQSPKPTNEAADRLDGFDANKEAHDQANYWDAQVGDAGKTDFSEEARQRLEEATEYDAYLEQMAARGSETEDEYYDRHAEEGSEDTFDRALRESPSLRRADMMAKDIAERRANGGDAEYIKQKEDELERILGEYAEGPDADEDVVSRIMDATVEASKEEAASPAADNEQKNTYNGRTAEELEDAVAAAEAARDSGAANKAQRELDIINLQKRRAENWAKKPEATPIDVASEMAPRNARPSEEDRSAAEEAMRRAAGAEAEASADTETTPTAATSPEAPVARAEAEAVAERRKKKFVTSVGRLLKRLMGDPEARQARKDKEEAERIARADKRAEKKANRRPGLFAGINDALGSERAKKQEAEPTDADKAAAAAAVKNAEIATDVRGAGKPSDDEWGPGVPGDPIPGSPEVATSSSSFPEVEKAFAEAEERAKEAEAKAQELEARQPEVVAAGEVGSILTPAGEQLLRDRVQAKREAEVAKGRLTMIKSMIERDQQNKREADYAQEAFAEAEERAKEAEAKAQELEARQPEVVAAGEVGSILTPAGEQLLRDKASATLRAKEARDRADDLKVRVDSSARNLVTYRQFVLEALN